MELIYLINFFIILESLELMIVLLNGNIPTKRIIIMDLLMSIILVGLYIDGFYLFIFLYWLLVFIYFFKKQVFIFYPTFLLVYFSLLLFICSFNQDAFIYQGILIMPSTTVSFSLFIIASLFVIVQVMYVIYLKRKVRINEYLFDVQFKYQDKEYKIIGFLDSGNEVYYHGYPLIILNNLLIEDYLKEDLIIIDEHLLIDVIKVDYLIVNNQKLDDIYVGVMKNLKYDCLLNKALMKGVM